MARRGLVSALILSVALTTACGGRTSGKDPGTQASGRSEAKGSGSTPGGPTAPVYQRFPPGTSLSVVAKWNTKENETKSLTQVVDRFTELTGVKVNYEGLGDGLGTVLAKRVSDGAPPDIAILPAPGILDSLNRTKALKPLGKDIESLVDSNFAPTWKQLGSIDGTLYGVWFKAANKSTVWYRTKAFSDAGIAPPKTWDELIAAASQMRRRRRTARSPTSQACRPLR